MAMPARYDMARANLDRHAAHPVAAQRMVVRVSACRMAYCMSRRGTPEISPAVQKVRRRLCGLTGWSIPIARASRCR